MIWILTSERVYNFCFERPYIPGLIISTTTFLSRYETYAHLASGNKPISAQVVNAMSAFGIGIITTIGLSFAGDLLHTHSLRTLYNKAKKLQLRLQNRESALEQEIQRSNTLALTAEDKIKSRVELARYYTKTLREAEAAREYREAIRLMTTRKEKDFSYVFFTKQLFKGPLYHLAKKAIRKIKGVDSTSIDQIILDLLDGDEAAIEFLEKKDLNLLNIQERYLYGLAYKLAGREQKGETIQRQAIEQAIFQGELVPFGEKSRNPCFRLRLDSFFLDEIIAKQGEKSALEKEEENCRTQARILKEYPNFDVPVPIGVLAVEDKHFYVMEFERGESLQKRIETSTCSQLDLEQIVTLTSILHANISLDQAAQPEREYQKYITNGLERLKTSQDAIDAISQGLIPIVESLNAIAKVVGQDPHPRNIHFKEYGGIVILDREPGKTTTLTAETADLLDYTQGIPEQTKQHVAQRQFKEFSKFSRTKTDSDQYMLAYLNCRILRALERFVVIEDREKAQGDIKNSLDALKVINDTFPNYYQTHHEEYSQLAKGLRMLYIK